MLYKLEVVYDEIIVESKKYFTLNSAISDLQNNWIDDYSFDYIEITNVLTNSVVKKIIGDESFKFYKEN